MSEQEERWLEEISAHLVAGKVEPVDLVSWDPLRGSGQQSALVQRQHLDYSD